jgi:hypothetical protein
MFFRTTAFNQPIYDWDVSAVTTMRVIATEHTGAVVPCNAGSFTSHGKGAVVPC